MLFSVGVECVEEGRDAVALQLLRLVSTAGTGVAYAFTVCAVHCVLCVCRELAWFLARKNFGTYEGQ